jgi:streptomycin 6-kinase
MLAFWHNVVAALSEVRRQGGRLVEVRTRGREEALALLLVSARDKRGGLVTWDTGWGADEVVENKLKGNE